jgi:hypothetical protein
VALYFVITAAWALTVARAIPYRDGDRGVFASVAERVVAGDRLYIDVWDNKEPLFYLTLALGRTVSPYIDVLLELIWLVAGSLATYSIARFFGSTSSTAALVGWAGAPLILTGGAYAAGFTHLPGTVLVLAFYALMLRGRLLVAGALLPVIAAFKILALPVAFAVLLVYLIRHRASGWGRIALGAGGVVVGLAALLLLRGELGGFLTLIRTNLTYSQADLADAYRWPIWSHIEPVLQGSTVATIAVITLILTLTWRSLSSDLAGLWWTVFAALASGLLVIAATGLWPHHAQILFTAAALSLVLLVVAASDLRQLRPAAFVVVIAATVLLNGAPSLRATADSLLSAPTRWSDLSRTAGPSQELLAVAAAGNTYARLGKNTDDTHAQGLRDLELVCYQFLQYPYDPPSNLSRIPECLPSADFVLVDVTLAPEPGMDSWNDFVLRSEQVLAEHFTCESADWGRLCIRNTESKI